MNYTPYSENKNKNYIFYIIIVVALIIIAVVAWIGLSNMNDPTTDPDTSMNESPNSDNSQEYNSNDSSYNDSITETPKDFVSEIIPSTPTDDTVSNQPYEKSYTMPINGDILKDFSADTLQFSQTFGDMRLHTAVDIACKEGAFISALTDGKVLSFEESTALGGVLTIDHGDGLIVKYACIKDPKFKAGDTLKSGDLIGAVGTVPNESSDQAHLHIEATKNNKPISILDLFK